VTHLISVVGPPEVFFTFTTPACSDSVIQFNDLTNYGAAQIISWQWDFGDGQTSTLQNPAHSYTLEGDYLVCLTAQNECSEATYCETITIFPDPISHFTYSFIENFEVAFLNQSVYANSLLWDFGDGQTSNELNPVHVYNSPGNYWVCLSVTNECSAESECDTITIIDNVGLESISREEVLIELFPNPAKEEIYIKTNFLVIYQVEILNSQGVLTDRFVLQNIQNNYFIYLLDKTPGFYMLRFYTEKGTVTKRLIIQ
jgi:PKD repeat protein